MEFQRKWRKIDGEFQRVAYNSKIQLTVSPGCYKQVTVLKNRARPAALFRYRK